MKTVTKKAEWLRADGQKTEVTITVSRGYGVEHHRDFNDGDINEYDKKIEVSKTEISVMSGGKEYKGLYVVPEMFIRKDLKDGGSVIALSDNKIQIGITAEKAGIFTAALNDATTEAETDNDEWVEVVAAIAKRETENKDYENHVRNVENMMTLNGRSF